MKRIQPIAILILLTLLIWGFIQSQKSSSKHKEEMQIEKEKVSKAYDSIKTINLEKLILSDSIKKNEIVVDSIEKLEETAKKEVKKWQYSYSKLVKAIPVDVRDSLFNYQQREVVLLSENKSINDALVLCDSAKTIQKVVIYDLKQVISLDSLKDAQRLRIIDSQGNMITLQEKEIKRIKKNRFFERLGFVGIIALLLI